MKVHLAFGKPQPWVLPMTLVCIAVGALAAVLLRVGTQEPAADAPLDQQLVYYQREAKQRQVELDRQKAEYAKMADSKVGGAEVMREMNNLRILAATVPIEGPGIEITIDDTQSGIKLPGDSEASASAVITHDFDLYMLVNELHASGAEAISINDERIGPNTAVRCVGPVVHVNHRPVAAPFSVKAVGHPDTLYGAVKLPNGAVDQLSRGGFIRVDVAKRDNLRMTAWTPGDTPLVGRVVPDAAR
jgi:uncharacterized protein YlxW (UPF0749 family)